MAPLSSCHQSWLYEHVQRCYLNTFSYCIFSFHFGNIGENTCLQIHYINVHIQLLRLKVYIWWDSVNIFKHICQYKRNYEYLKHRGPRNANHKKNPHVSNHCLLCFFQIICLKLLVHRSETRSGNKVNIQQDI